MPNSLAVGSGIARGVGKFIENFTQGRMMKHQQKMQENAPLIALLTRQIENDDLSLDDRAEMTDAIPGLLGIKNMPQRLSQHFGLDKIRRDQIVADPQNPGRVATPNSNLKDTNVDSDNELGINPNIEMQGTSAEQAGQIRYGSLTPNDLKLQRVLKLKQADSVDDIDKQKQLLELQQRLYLRGGYNIIPNSGFFDDNGNYFQKAMNTAGETKNISFGKVKPAAIALQEEKNKKVPAGKLGQMMQVEAIINEYEADQTSHPLSAYNAAKEIKADFELNKPLKQAQIEALLQGNTGTKRIQPAQKEDDDRANAQLRDKIQSDINSSRANLNAAQKVIADLTPRKKKADDELKSATEAFDKLVASDDYTPEDAEYKAANNKKIIAQQQVNQISTQLNKATSDHETANSLLNGSMDRMNSVGKPTTVVNLTPAQKATIAKIRKQNPEATKNMTDEAILNAVKH